MTTERLLELVTALGKEVARRSLSHEVEGLRRYYLAIRQARARPPAFTCQVGAGETWSVARVLERLGTLGLLEVTMTRFRSSNATPRGRH